MSRSLGVFLPIQLQLFNSGSNSNLPILTPTPALTFWKFWLRQNMVGASFSGSETLFQSLAEQYMKKMIAFLFIVQKQECPLEKNNYIDHR